MVDVFEKNVFRFLCFFAATLFLYIPEAFCGYMEGVGAAFFIIKFLSAAVVTVILIAAAFAYFLNWKVGLAVLFTPLVLWLFVLVYLSIEEKYQKYVWEKKSAPVCAQMELLLKVFGQNPSEKTMESVVWLLEQNSYLLRGDLREAAVEVGLKRGRYTEQLDRLVQVRIKDTYGETEKQREYLIQIYASWFPYIADSVRYHFFHSGGYDHNKYFKMGLEILRAVPLDLSPENEKKWAALMIKEGFRNVSNRYAVEAFRIMEERAKRLTAKDPESSTVDVYEDIKKSPKKYFSYEEIIKELGL